jgi:hypothetical protein
LIEIVRKFGLGETFGRQQDRLLIVILPSINTEGSGQEVGRYVLLAGDVLEFEVEWG